jgi:hypothetical protein
VSSEFEIKTFNLDEIGARKYPFDTLEIGQGFSVPMVTSGISGRVSSENKKSEKAFVTRSDPDSTPENPKSWVIRVK